MTKVVAPIVAVILGLLGAVAFVQSKTPVETSRPITADPLVRVVSVRTVSVALSVTAQGTVLPRTETTLASQVAAAVVSTSPHFEAGGFFERGEALVQLDRREYELKVERASAQVAQAELRLVQQQAEAQVAAAEWSELGEGRPDPLVLREPQMAEARAMLKAAEAELGMARLALDRTVIRAPFNGRVHSTRAGVGQYLTSGQEVATIHAIDFAEVRLPVPDHQLAYLDLPLAFGDDIRHGPATLLSARFAGQRRTWPGTIVRAEGELDRRSRMMHLVVRVEDPYSRHQPDRPPLAMGLFVEAEITGHTVVGSLLPRSALRDDGQVLVVDEDERLRLRDVHVVRIERDIAIVDQGLADGERVCVSPLEVAVDGMQVRTTEVEAPELPNTQIATAELPADALGPADPPSRSSRLLAVSWLEGDRQTALDVSVGGDFTYATSRLDSPERFVIDLLGVIKASPRSALEMAEGPVERVRIGQYQAEPEPIARVVFDLRQQSNPIIEQGGGGLTIRF